MIVDTNSFDTYIEHRKYLSDNIDRIIEDGLIKLKKFDGLNKIIIIGYTPSFNDGDPCEHWSTPYYDDDLYEIADDNQEFLGLPENLEYDEYEDYLDENPINIINQENSDEIRFIIGHLEDLLEEQNDTNFKVYIDLTGEEPTIEVQHYYCGY